MLYGRNEMNAIKKIVMLQDPEAFIIISNAREVFGKGFRTWKELYLMIKF